MLLLQMILHWLKWSLTKPVDGHASIELLCKAGSLRLHNWTAQNIRPDCTIKARWEFDASLYDPLSITGLYGSDDALRE